MRKFEFHRFGLIAVFEFIYLVNIFLQWIFIMKLDECAGNIAKNLNVFGIFTNLIRVHVYFIVFSMLKWRHSMLFNYLEIFLCGRIEDVCFYFYRNTWGSKLGENTLTIRWKINWMNMVKNDYWSSVKPSWIHPLIN